MSAQTYIWIVQIAGLARDGLTSSNSTTRERIEAMALTTASAEAQPAGSICDEWQSYVIPGSLRMGEMSFGPLTGKVASSSVSFDLRMDDNRPELGRFFLAPLRAKKPILQLDAGESIGATGTSAAFTPIEDPSATLASLGVAEGSILYNGREALRVASVNDTTDVITFVDALPMLIGGGTVQKSTQGEALRRGHCGTYIETHEAIEPDAEPPFVDARWFDVSPFVSGREVRILRYDGASATEEVWWRGVIDGEPTLAGDGVTLTVKCVDIFQALKNATINTRGGIGRASNVYRLRIEDDSPLTIAFVYEYPVSTADQLYKTGNRRGYVYQIGKSVIAGTVLNRSVESSALRITSVRNAFGGDLLDIGSYAERVTSTNEKINELLVSDPLDATSPAAKTPVFTTDLNAGAADHPLYCTDLPDRTDLSSTRSAIVDHPVLIALALMRGLTCPNLPDHWTIPIPTEFLDLESFINVAYETYEEIDSWPGMVAGKDGKPIKALKFINEELLNGLGIGLAYGDPSEGKGGQIVVRSLFGGNQNLADDVTLSALNSGRGATIQTRLAADSLIVRSGQGIGNKPRFTNVAGEAFRTRFFPYDAGNVELKTPGLVHPNNEDESLLLGDTGRVAFLSGVYRQFAALLRTPLVTVNRRVTSDRLLYPGQWLLVSNTGGIDQSTGLRDTTTAATTLAVVVRVTPDLSAALDQAVDLLLFPFGLSRIGPAGEVASGTSSTVVLETDEFLGEVNPYEPTPDLSAERDADTFEVGQKVILLTSALEKATQVEEISGISGNTITISGTWTAVGGGAYTPNVGDILTLADFSDSNEAEQTTYAFVAENDWTL